MTLTVLHGSEIFRAIDIPVCIIIGANLKNWKWLDYVMRGGGGSRGFYNRTALKHVYQRPSRLFKQGKADSQNIEKHSGHNQRIYDDSSRL